MKRLAWSLVPVATLIVIGIVVPMVLLANIPYWIR